MARLLNAFLFGMALLGRVWAQPAAIPEAETFFAPTPQRLAAAHAAAQRDGWAPHIAPLRDAALRSYEKDKLGAAEAWFNVYRWASVLALTDTEFVARWIDAVNAAKVGHPNMPSSYPRTGKPLGSILAPELQAWLLGNAAFSAEFFALIQSVDYVPEVFRILNDIHRRDPAKFKSHASLALAIAVVYDLPPPPIWPHGQVNDVALPRKLPPATDAFAWWVKQEQLGRLHHKLSRLGAADLRFVVDAAAPFPELEWSQHAANKQLPQLAEAYTLIRYRTDRLAANVAVWPGRTYTLEDILRTGGICADQAYFATQVGKARGVPTLLIYGAGNDGRHAWFGYLDGNQKWQLDAGRYAEQRFVTGYARDPQTWREFSDHELKFLSERFRELPAFRQSRVHEAFAEDYLRGGNPAAASVAARKAVTFERRNQAGWELLVAAAKKTGRDAKTVENLWREAALAFQRYPDLEAYYVNRVADSLRTRGQTSEADNEMRRIAIKNQGERVDLSIQQARETVQRAIKTQPLPEQIKSYNSILDLYGRGAGVTFFDQVVVTFAEHLVQLRQPAEAVRAVERARRTLKVEPNSQLEREFARLMEAVKKG
ncbi:MAG TPA: hypothetical protein VM029_16740 [Opitutaceae bacterium]|nr:hypothetical protein [Opitutaceae bacterium]